MRTWHLRSAEADHDKWPDTFEILPRETRSRLVGGQIVKLIFELNDGGGSERMWVEIGTVRNEGGVRYTGTLKNTPFSQEFGLAWGDEIEFGPEYICSIEESGDESTRVN